MNEHEWGRRPSGWGRWPPPGCAVCGRHKVGYVRLSVGGVEKKVCSPSCEERLVRLASVVEAEAERRLAWARAWAQLHPDEDDPKRVDRLVDWSE